MSSNCGSDVSFGREKVKESTHPVGSESEEPRDRIQTQRRNDDTPSITGFDQAQDKVASCMNTVDPEKMDINEFHHLPPFDDASSVVNEEDQEARHRLISMVLTILRIVRPPPLLSLIYARDGRAPKVRLCEELTPAHHIESFGTALFVLRHILEVPFTIGHGFDLLQVDLTVIVEEHHELPAWHKVRHYE